jgi:hypothetical protein
MDFLDYIQTLPPASVDRLYKSGWACVAIFRTVSALSQQIVLRLLQVSEWPQASVKQWAAADSIPAFQSALDRLVNTRVAMRRQSPSGYAHSCCVLSIWAIHANFCCSPVITLNASFRELLQTYLFMPTPEVGMAVVSPTSQQLGEFANEKWNAALYFMAGLDGAEEPSEAVVQVLLDTGLMNACVCLLVWVL